MRRRRGAQGGRTGEGGFTLAEILIASAIFGLIMGSVLLSYVGYRRAFVVATSYIGVRSDIRIAMDSMARDIRWTIEPVASHGSYTNSATCLILKVPSIHPKGTPPPIPPAGEIINVGTTFDYIVYRKNGTILERIVIPNHTVANERWESEKMGGGASTVARNIQSLSFTMLDRNNATTSVLADAYAVQAALTVGGTVRAATSTDTSEHLSTTVTFRNTTARPPTPTPAH